MKTQPLFLSIMTIVFFGGCGPVTQSPNNSRDLCIRNETNQDIIVSIQTGTRRETFGVVSPNAGKTIGFGSGTTGEKITVLWQIDTLKNPQLSVTLPVPDPTNGKVTLTYQKDGTWTTITHIDTNKP